MINIVRKSHEILMEFPNPNIAIDMTAGRGNDTLFLSKIAKKVYAFDIQDEAIKSTKELLESELVSNVSLIQDNHRFVKTHVKSNIDLAIYNLGFLPKGNKKICTNADDVIHSLEYLLEILNLNGIIVIVIYMHNSDEEMAVLKYTSALPKEFDVSKFEVLNKQECPYIIKIRRTQF